MTGKNKKRLAAGAAICMGAGIVLGIMGFLSGGRPGFYVNATGIHAYPFRENGSGGNTDNVLEKTALDGFLSIDIHIPAGNLTVIPSDGYYLEYYLPSVSEDVAYSVKDGTFTLNTVDGGTTFFGFNWNFLAGSRTLDGDYVNLYVPQDVYFENITISNDLGNVALSDIHADYADITLDLGALDIGNFEGNECHMTMCGGDLTAGQLICDTLSIESDMGGVSIEQLECSEGSVTMDMGDFSADEASLSVFDVTSSMGSVTAGIQGSSGDYNLDLSTDMGSVHIREDDQQFDSDMSHYVSHTENETQITVQCDMGDIDLSFK